MNNFFGKDFPCRKGLVFAIILIAITTPYAASWGTGTDAGSFSNDVWTPGRDNDGVVNLASWNLVPTNRWIDVSGTRLDGLDAEVKAAVPGWRDLGSWRQATEAWAGMAWDERAGSERGWFAVAGGHSNSSNDGIYEFALRKMKWRIQRLPSDMSWWPSAYTGSYSYTNFTPAADYYYANQGNPEGVFYDEIFDPNNQAKSIRTPTARHTYGSTVFAPGLGDSGKILMGCRRYWEYDLATNTWDLPKFPFGTGVNYAGNTGYTGENMQGWWNEVEGRYYVSATQDYNSSQTWSVLAGGTGWRWEGWYPTGGYETIGNAQERLGRKLFTLHYEFWGSTDSMWMIETNLDTRAKTYHPVNYGSTFAGTTWNLTNGWDGQGMTFVPEIGKWFCNAWINERGFIWCWLDTTNWTLEITSIPGAYPTSINGSTETKIKYLPDLQSLVWINYADQNIRLIKFGPGSGQTSTEMKSATAVAPRLWNAPQPFNAGTRICYQLPSAAKVSLTIFDATGRVVSVLASENKTAGMHSVQWVGRDNLGAVLPGGMYLSKLETTEAGGKKMVVSNKMILLR